MRRSFAENRRQGDTLGAAPAAACTSDFFAEHTLSELRGFGTTTTLRQQGSPAHSDCAYRFPRATVCGRWTGWKPSPPSVVKLRTLRSEVRPCSIPPATRGLRGRVLLYGPFAAGLRATTTCRNPRTVCASESASVGLDKVIGTTGRHLHPRGFRGMARDLLLRQNTRLQTARGFAASAEARGARRLQDRHLQPGARTRGCIEFHDPPEPGFQCPRAAHRTRILDGKYFQVRPGGEHSRRLIGPMIKSWSWMPRTAPGPRCWITGFIGRKTR